MVAISFTIACLLEFLTLFSKKLITSIKSVRKTAISKIKNRNNVKVYAEI